MRCRCIGRGVFLMLLLLVIPKAEAFIMINEILADPPVGIAGDANNDGIGSWSRDEFVELFNPDSSAVDLSGWYLSDNFKTRHIFSPGTFLDPGRILVIFASGLPELPGINWEITSTGSWGLNNGGDTVTLYDLNDVIINEVSYGSEGGDNQSLVRSPEGSGSSFIPHTLLPGANGDPFSPGYFVNGAPGAGSTVPEPATLCYLSLGLAAMLRKRRFLIR